MGHELETHKRYYDTYKVSQAAENKQNLEKLRQGIIKYEKEIELSKKTTERNNAQKLQTKEIQVQKTMKSFEVELVEKKANTTTEIEKVVAAREFQAQQDAERLTATQREIKDEATEADTDRKIKQANYNVLKESFKNAT